MKTFIDGPAYLELPSDPTPWIIKSLIPAGGLVNLYGRPKSHKSFFGLQMASAIATPTEEVLGFKVVKSGRVAYLQIDTPRSMWKDRLKMLSEGGMNIKGIFFADSLLVPEYPFNILKPGPKDWLKERLYQLSPVVVFIDTLREFHGGDENDSTVMRNVIGNAVECVPPNCAIVFVSHTRKQQTIHIDDITEDQRGSGYVAGRMDNIIKLTDKVMMVKGRATPEIKLKVSHNDMGCLEHDHFTLDNHKAIDIIFKSSPGIGTVAAAHKLSEALGISEAAALKRIQRWMQKQKGNE